MGTLTGMQMAGLGLSTVRGVADYKVASTQYKVDEANRALNNRNATDALMTSYRALETETTQVAEDALSTAIDQQRASAVAVGAVQAEAGASGTGGTGADMQVDDISVESSRNNAKAVMNKNRQLDQIAMQRTASQNAFKSRVQLMPAQKPSKGAHAVGAGARGFRNVLAMGSLGRASNQAKRATQTKSYSTESNWQSRQQAGIV